MHKESLILLHDVETYDADNELGNCYLFSAWSNENKCLNWNVDNAEMRPTNTEYMGICTLPNQRDELYDILMKTARQPITTPYLNYASEDQKADGNYLGITTEDISVKLKNFMLKYYDESFTEEFISCLLDNLTEYQSKEIYHMHKSQLLRLKEVGACPTLLISVAVLAINNLPQE